MVDDILTLGEAGNYLKVGERTVRRMIKDGRIVATKVGKQWRISKRLLQEYVERGVVTPHRVSVLDQYERRTGNLNTMAEQVILVTKTSQDDYDRHFGTGFAHGLKIARGYIKNGQVTPSPMMPAALPRLINEAIALSQHTAE